MGKSKKKEIIIISHSHWDREWYKSHEETLFRLIELAQMLVEIYQSEPERAPYWLDGQTVVVEDLLEIADEPLSKAFTDLLNSKKVLIGPWYTLSDELLVSGESQIRNLFLGRKIMVRYGQLNQIGYLPDTFGHISQMPQILRGFGITNAILWRGYRRDERHYIESNWEGASGDKVDAVCLIQGYTNAKKLSLKDIGDNVEQLKEAIRDLEAKTGSSAILLMNGCDLALPSYNIEEIIAKLSAAIPEYEWRAGTFEYYLNKIKEQKLNDVKPLKGELLFRPQIDGTLSSRGSIKRANRHIENMLIGYAEPLDALSRSLRGIGNSKFLERAWKLVVQNHAHDSICGNHSDAVAKDVKMRFHRAKQIAENVIKRALYSIAGQNPERETITEDTYILLYNPTQWEYRGILEISIDFPTGTPLQQVNFICQGQKIRSQILSFSLINRFVEDVLAKWKKIEYNNQRCSFAVDVSIPPTGFSVLDVSTGFIGKIDIMDATQKEIGEGIEAHSYDSIGRYLNVLDNGLIEVKIERDGSFSILDKSTGILYEELNVIADFSDPGDLYESCFSPDMAITKADPGSIKLVRNGSLVATILIESGISCVNHNQSCPLEVYLTLKNREKKVDIKLRFLNKVDKHCLKAIFKIPESAELKAHMPFDMVKRKPDKNQLFFHEGKLRRLNSPLQPMHYLIYAEKEGKEGLFILNRGIYEFYWEGGNLLEVTLLRAAGEIRENLSMFDSSGGNELGWNTIEYSVGVAEDIESALKAAYQYNLSPLYTQFFGKCKPLPSSIVSFSNSKWILSSIKRAENEDGIIIRFWNCSEKEERGEVITGFEYSQAWSVRIDETCKELCNRELTLGPKEIKTILFENVSWKLS